MRAALRGLYVLFGLVLPVVGVPGQVAYEGRLFQESEGPSRTNVSVVVAVYTNAVGGTPRYVEIASRVPVIDGKYQLNFGGDDARFLAALRGPQAWLEITVKGSPPTRRQQLVSVPYALVSAETLRITDRTRFPEGAVPGAAIAERSIPADRLGDEMVRASGHEMSGLLRLPEGGLRVGENQVVVRRSGAVGINTATPEHTLSVAGTVGAEALRLAPGKRAPSAFGPAHKRMSLAMLRNHVKTFGRLPGLPTREQLESDEVDVGGMQFQLLQKIEEIVQYLLELEQENAELRARLRALEEAK